MDRSLAGRRLPVLLIGALLAFLISWPDAGATATPSYDNALAEARTRSTFVLVDTYAPWCGPCKLFQADYDTIPALREAFSPLVFVSVNIEDSLSAAFNQRHPVSSIPQFILIDGNDVECGRIVGYVGPEKFLEELKQLLADPRPVEEKLANARADESWEGPAALANHYVERKEYREAAPYYSDALERGAPGELRLELLFVYLTGMFEGWATVEQARRVGEEALANPADVDRYWYRLYSLMWQVAVRAKNDSLRQPYLERAVEEARASGNLERDAGLRFDYANYVLKDYEAAARARHEQLELQPNPGFLNLYAWYCFEHRVCLDEAEAVAREGAAMDGPPAHLAMITNTLAELVNLRGETAEALALIERCIELDPANDYYRRQEKRFREILGP
ncbi:MAG: thioredoxin domain-containing protein [Gemmatimonadota bacterium]|nr:thioredoxin domain-containing protein [Gemmatimonadota bacterium]